MSEDDPSGSPIAAAVLAAIAVPLIGVAMIFSWEMSAGQFPSVLAVVLLFGTPIAAAHVLALGLPAYLFIKARGPVEWWHAATVGMVCGGVPAFLVSGAEPSVTVLFAASGVVGGLAFWATLHLPDAGRKR
jgi:CDP-diglyceride synthetase